VALLLLLAGGSLYYALRPRAPTYQGKTSAQWFHQFEKAIARYWTIPFRTPSVVLTRNPSVVLTSMRALDERALGQDQAARALRALGTNAALYLGREYTREDGRLAINYRKIYGQVPVVVRKILPEPAPTRSIVRMHVGWALDALGNNAAPAVPGLLSVLRVGDMGTQYATLGILRRLPFNRHLLDPILDNWSRNGEHSNVLLVVTDLQVHTRTAVACLARILVEGDLTLRRSSLWQLEKCGPAGAGALPELIAALTDADDEVRYDAARALVAIGPEAIPAIPALILATTDSSIMVQRASARALLAIRGQSQD
jgi:hypothetical protein